LRLGLLFVISLLLSGDSPSRLEQFITYPGVQNSPTNSVAGGASVPGDQELHRNPPDVSVARGSCSWPRRDVFPDVLSGNGLHENSPACGGREESRRRSPEGTTGDPLRPLARFHPDFPEGGNVKFTIRTSSFLRA